MAAGQMTVYLKPDLVERIRAAAEYQGVSTSTFLRMAALQKLRNENEEQSRQQAS